MAVFDFIIQLTDKVSSPAKSAEKSLSATAQQMKVLQGAAKSTQNALTKADALGDIKKHKALTQQLGSFKAALSVLPKEASNASSGMGGLQAELAEVTGGLSIVVEAAAAVGLAFGTVVVAGAAMAIEANEAKERMTALFDALGEGKISGQQTVAMLNDLSGRISIARSELAPLTTEFMKMGVTGKDALEGLTLAAVSAKALGGGTDAAAEAFVKLEAKIQLAAATGQKMKNPLKAMQAFGITVDDVSSKMGVTSKELAAGLKSGTVDAAKFGDALQKAVIEKGAGPLEKMAGSITNLKKTFMDNIGKMFEDIDVGPFLAEVKKLFVIFGQGKESGKALKAGIGGFFKEVFALATKVVPYIKHFLLDLVILGLKAYIGLKPIVKAFNEWRTSASGMKTISSVLSAIGTALETIGVVVVVVVAVFASLSAALVVMQVAFATALGAILGFVTDAGSAISDWVGGAAKAAYNFVSGLVSGISGGAGMVVDAVKGLAGSATSAFKSALGIASPSKVMAGLGGHVASGAAEGIDDGASDVHAASSGLASAAAGGFAGGGGPGGKGSGGGVTVTVQPGAIVIQGGAKGAAELTEEAVSLIFERVALAQGL